MITTWGGSVVRETDVGTAALSGGEHRQVPDQAALPTWAKDAARQDQPIVAGSAPAGSPAAALAGDWSEEVLTGTVLPHVLGGAVPQPGPARPVVVFVAGQPGSGKTMVVDLVHAALMRRGGAVRVDRDAYKTIHPHYTAFLAEDVRTAGVRVRPETYRWQADIEARVREGRYDAVVEAPLAHTQEFLAGMAAYRQAGYRVEILALAVPEAVSQLGILDRYLRLAEEGRARYVSWDNHDTCAAALLETLAVVETTRLADRIFVVRRADSAALEVVYDNELDSCGDWRRPIGAARAVLAERRRPWDARETGRFRRQLADADRRLTDPRLPEDWALAVGRDAERAAALAEPVRRTAQPRREPPGVDYHRLSAEEHRFIFDELIVPSLGRITPQEKPVAVYVMGQPGAGKTRAAQMVRRTLRDGPAHITGDDFKVAHPDYLQLLREEPRTASARIRADYRAWQAQAEAYVRERRGDVVIELTPGSTAEFVTGAALYRQAGYRVELVVLAVRPADSRQGTAVRYAQVGQRGLPARFTTAAGHDTHFAVLPEVVAAAEQLSVADSVMVMRRDAHLLYHNDQTAPGRWAQRPAAELALVAEQSRPYTPEEAAPFWAVQRWLHAAMPQYRDDLIAIAGLACPLMPAQQPRQLHAPVPAAALALLVSA
ncbi:zeta toxin family protein [Streptomyces malaysiensis]|uniref:UDP-N-acetylglucosamine kinase n=1 Tax=Streptomyces malaysiensis subsp. samsunensis TaxID=459658 RepID=A0A9X2M5M7_STRMQ|nr:zeta toxin family protein [Streptomyces samsunensis]MCQ8835802.1 zeta toxin family protein [Streptomyces samsunensis]